MTSCAWLWIYAGSVLMLLELVVPGFVLCFFGLGAATVGIVRSIFGEAFTLAWQLAVFSFTTVLYIVLFRKGLKRIFVGNLVETSTDFEHESVGRHARVTVAIDPPAAGRILLGDAEWSAVSSSPIAVGADVRVVEQNNLTMRVEPLS